MSFHKVSGLFLLAGVLGACGGEMPVPGQEGVPPTSPQDQDALYEWLIQEEVTTASVMRIQVTPEDLAPLFDNDEPRLRIGVTKPLGERVDFSRLQPVDLTPTPRPFANGGIRGTKGGFVWTGVVESAGAGSLRLEFVDFSLPDGASLYLYNDRGQVSGPFIGNGPTGDGSFWSNSLYSERVYLQLRYEGVDVARGLQNTSMSLGEVGHSDPGFDGEAAKLKSDLCNNNKWCIDNAANADIPEAIESARHADARLRFVDGRYMYLCSGGLILDYEPTGDGPYLLTANHCINTQDAADTVEAYFHVATDYGEPCGTPDPTDIQGAWLRANSSDGDFSLLELWQPAPLDTVALPWTDQPVTDGDMLYRISHPSGAPQAFSVHMVDNHSWQCSTLPVPTFIYSQNIDGSTEGGSSGSVVVNSNGEIVGQLYGKCGWNLNDVCDYEQNRTVDGAINASALGTFLGAPSPCTEDPDCDDLDDCNGTETCDLDTGRCLDGTLPIGCDDGIACTDDTCANSACVFTPNSANCSDGITCTLDTCDVETGACLHEADDNACDDGDECTYNVCDPGGVGGCDFPPIDGCVPDCGARGDWCDSSDDCCSNRCNTGLNACK
ncbi:MAG: trypsin-like peptidase domain-containing protein [Deltaproteobacteria bacterium]|nr:trypsin-like peptidase domain-containing protein [Deltaproteobacteria bacterium]